MRKLFFTLLAVASLTSNCLYAQIAIKSGGSYNCATGVSDEGVVCGYPAFGDPYELWFPETNSTKVIGGVGPGLGVGGSARFSVNGKYLSGSDSTTIELSTNWERTALDQDYTLTNMALTDGGITIATGRSDREGDKSILLTNAEVSNFGKRWMKNPSIFHEKEARKIMALSFPVFDTAYIGGDEILAKSVAPTMDWEYLQPIPNVKFYQALDFTDADNGVVGVMLKGGGVPWSSETCATDDVFAVYVTSDGGTSWTKATGVTGTPASITHTDENTYYMVTDYGTIQKSTDKGLTWENLVTGMLGLRKIKFYDKQTGIITARNAVYKTTDGGTTWNPLKIAEGVTDNTYWNDVAWLDAQNLVLVGSKDLIYTSSDGGNNWIWTNQELSDGQTDLYAIAVNSELIRICGDKSTFYKKSLTDKKEIVCAARYDLKEAKWESLGFLGGSAGEVASGGYAISGDGKTVVGNSYAPFDENKLYTEDNGFGSYCHGVAWSEEEGFMDLGSMFPKLCKDARCDVVSNDGSVIAGYQAGETGFWHSSIWRKNPEGGYFPHEFILLDPKAGTDKEENRMGQCTAVSANGQWIGGISDYYHSEAWIWSEATGVINLGGPGRVQYINDTGDLVIGNTFIWTKKEGNMSITDYLQTTKKYNLGELEILAIQSVSPNGRYLAGCGVKSDGVTFRIDLDAPSAIQEEKTNGTSVYLNSAADLLNVNLSSEGAQLDLFDTQGRMVLSQTVDAKQVMLSTSGLADGLYFLHVSTKGLVKTFKVQIVH